MQKFLDDTPVFAPVTGAVVRPLPEIVTARFVCETIGESTRLARQRDSRSARSLTSAVASQQHSTWRRSRLAASDCLFDQPLGRLIWLTTSASAQRCKALTTSASWSANPSTVSAAGWSTASNSAFKGRDVDRIDEQ